MNENGIISRILPLGSYSFFLEIYFAMLILLFNSKKRKHFILYVIAEVILGIGFYFLPYFTVGFLNFNYITIVLSCFILSVIPFKESPFVLFFASFAGWGLQHISWNIAGVIYDLIPNVRNLSDIVLNLILAATYIFFYVIAFLFIWKSKIKLQYSKNHLVSFLLSLIMLSATMLLSQAVETWTIVIRLYTTLVALLSLLIMYGYPHLSNLISKEKELQNEKTNLEKMLELQANQQKLSKQATDTLNLKFHDMKNQLLLMKNVNEEERNKISNELEKSIDVYTNIARTGNEAMDIVVTQKSLLCTSDNIRFTYILSGECVSFMNKSDITSLYGNILDNAIEAVKNEKGDFRLIKLKTFTQNGLVLIQEENYCHSAISFNESGLPISKKKDSINHGYGSKSIRYIVEKYHGQLKMRQEENIYYLDIAIPVPDNQTCQENKQNVSL